MGKRFILLSLFFITISTFLEAGTCIGRSGLGSVEGFVYDGLTASRLMGVRIEVPGRSPVYTDHLGFFKIKDLPIGINRLVFRLTGYIPQEEVFVVYEDECTYLSVFMWPIFGRYIPPLYPYHYRLSYPAPEWWFYSYPYCPYCYYWWRYYPYYPHRYWRGCLKSKK